jgi:hypothetical protein
LLHSCILFKDADHGSTNPLYPAILARLIKNVGEAMKTLLVLVAMFVAQFAQANSLSYDCTKGQDNGYGGKYCHYSFPDCTQDSCQEAAKCIVEKVAREREGKIVKAYLADSTDVVRDGEAMQLHRIQSQKQNCNGRQCLTPIYVYTQVRRPDLYKGGQCEALIVEVLGSQN